MATIAVIGTLDTKGHEHEFVAQRIRAAGHTALLIDVGTRTEPQIEPDISRFEVAASAGIDLSAILSRADRGECVSTMTSAAPVLIGQLVKENKIDGVIALGGSGGTAIACAAMRALPIGIPKLMVSTMASGNIAEYVGTKDIVMMPSIVDVSGLNRISRMIFTRAADAICGMCSGTNTGATIDHSADRPIVAASMFGNTTDCVNVAKARLEDAGYEVLVFHSTGAGGRSMEALIESGMITGVLDVTTTEWADEVVGGVLSAGPSRLLAAAKSGTPAVIAPGCLDMVNFGPRESIPRRFADRNLYVHNPQITLMRTSAEECTRIGKAIAQRVNQSTGPVSILLPQKAISIISAQGQAFHDTAADQALFNAITCNLRADIEVISSDSEINDAEFANACAEKLLSLMASRVSEATTS